MMPHVHHTVHSCTRRSPVALLASNLGDETWLDGSRHSVDIVSVECIESRMAGRCMARRGGTTVGHLHIDIVYLHVNCR